MVCMDRELHRLASGLGRATRWPRHAQYLSDELSKEGAEYLARIATDGTLKAALAELAASDPG